MINDDNDEIRCIRISSSQNTDFCAAPIIVIYLLQVNDSLTLAEQLYYSGTRVNTYTFRVRYELHSQLHNLVFIDEFMQ